MTNSEGAVADGVWDQLGVLAPDGVLDMRGLAKLKAEGNQLVISEGSGKVGHHLQDGMGHQEQLGICVSCSPSFGIGAPGAQSPRFLIKGE